MKFYEDEIYIKMRVKAIPFLGEGSFSANASIPISHDPAFIRVDNKGNFYFEYHKPHSVVLEHTALVKRETIYFCQLERQDQLQEMILKYFEGNSIWRLFPTIMIEFNNFCMFYSDSNVVRVDCFEGLWLMFVMDKVYNKTWSEEDWV